MIIDFKIPNSLIVASHITGIYDVNRNTTLANDDFSMVADWARSIEALELHGIIFHNNFSEETCKLHQSDQLYFVKIDYNSLYNPNVFRYFVYEAFLKSHAHLIENIFFTDISDVVVLKNPFQEKLYLDNPTGIFCGDEREILDNIWMQKLQVISCNLHPYFSVVITYKYLVAKKRCKLKTHTNYIFNPKFRIPNSEFRIPNSE